MYVANAYFFDKRPEFFLMPDCIMTKPFPSSLFSLRSMANKRDAATVPTGPELAAPLTLSLKVMVGVGEVS